MAEKASPTKAPRTDDGCYPFPCRDYHETLAHIEGEDPCACPCHMSEAEARMLWGDR